MPTKKPAPKNSPASKKSAAPKTATKKAAPPKRAPSRGTSSGMSGSGQRSNRLVPRAEEVPEAAEVSTEATDVDEESE